MFKRLATYTTIALALSACSDEDFTLPNGVGEDGTLDISFAVPEMQKVATRAGVNENDVNSIRMLVIADGAVKQITDYSSDDIIGSASPYSVKVNIRPEIRANSNLQFYFIANLPEGVTLGENMTPDDIKAMTYADVYNIDGSMPMSGYASLTDLTEGNNVALVRNAAKVTVSGAVNEGTDANPDWAYSETATTYPFSVYSTASVSGILAGASDNQTSGEATKADIGRFDGNTVTYVHSTENGGTDVDNRPFTIVKAPYNGTEYYYRVDFSRVKNDSDEIEYLDLKPNHWYQILVKSVDGVGDRTPAAAAANPTPLLSVTIYDVCPQSFNMITDGTRELGVTHELVYTGDAGIVTEPSDLLYIKLYSRNDYDYPTDTERIKDYIRIADSWLGIESVAEANSDEWGFASASPESATKGKLYKVVLKYIDTPTPGTVNTTITVDWKGLQREIPVTWSKEFNGVSLCDVTLIIKDYSGKEQLNVNYWDFLSQTVKGVGVKANNDNIRNEGLHFPVMYGETGKLWTYTYVLKFNSDLFAATGSTYELGTEGDVSVQFIPSNGTANKTDGLTVTVTKSGNDWDYSTGQLTLSVDGQAPYKLPLYHTGFFHNHDAVINTASTKSYAANSSDVGGWYYYEVRTDKNGYHWLDRNLGAESAALYIQATNDITYHGDSMAAGGYYHVAGYNNSTGQPDMKPGLCPPGFEVPREDIWNLVRTNGVFSQVGNYYTAYYMADDDQPIYFPKARYIDIDGNKSGESRAGYYWSSTKASGLEKDQIGNWLKTLVISGNSTTYINGQVSRSANTAGASDGFAMSVRCVGKATQSGSVNHTYFNVKGATNVYIYKIDPITKERIAAYSWPGKAIGDYNTMANGTMNFVYDSPTTAPEDLYVIFSYKDKNGKIHTASKGTDGGTLYSTTENLNNLNGWKVVGDSFKQSDGTTVKTACGGTWTFSNQTTQSSALVSYSGGDTPTPPEPTPEMVTVYFQDDYPNIPNSNTGNVYIEIDGYRYIMTSEKIAGIGWWKYTSVPSNASEIRFCSASSGTSHQSQRYTSIADDYKNYGSPLYYQLDTDNDWSIKRVEAPVTSGLPALASGYYRVYWKRQAPNSSTGNIINLDCVYSMSGTGLSETHQLIGTRFTYNNIEYNYFDFKPASDSFNLSFIIKQNTDNWNNQSNNINIDNSHFSDGYCRITLTGNPNFGFKATSGKP